MAVLQRAPADDRREPASGLGEVIEAFQRSVSAGGVWQDALERAFEALSGAMDLSTITFSPASREPLATVTWQTDPAQRKTPHASSAVVPVVFRGHRLGTMLAHRAARRPFKTAEYGTLQWLASALAIVLHASHVRSSERELLANGLHDEIAPMLFVARIALEGFRDAPDAAHARDRVVHAIELVERSERALRGMIESLDPPSDGILSVLPERMRALQERYRVAIEFTAGDGIAGDLAPDAEDALIRAAHEGVSNAVKHCAPGRIDVTLVRRDRWLSLTVVNDGTCRETSCREGGHGLASLGKDMRRLGGTVQFAVRPSGGAELRVRLPVP